MKANHLVSVDYGVHLLARVFPGENWSLYVAKNICGQLNKEQQIPFQMMQEIAYFFTDDLRAFAIQHGAGKIPENDIVRLVDDYLDHIDLFGLSDMVDRMFDPSSLDDVVDILDCDRSEVDGLNLSELECHILLERIDTALGIQRDTAKALASLAFFLGEPDFLSRMTAIDVDVCRRPLIHHAKQANRAYIALAELKQAIENRGAWLSDSIDDDLDKLLGDLTTTRLGEAV